MNAHLPPHSNQQTPRALLIAAFIRRLRVCYECFCYLGRDLGSHLGVYGVNATRLLRVMFYRMAGRGALSFASAPAVRTAWHHSTQMSRYFAHIVGLVVIAGVILCWLSPALRQAFMIRLAPVFQISPKSEPTMQPSLVSAAVHFNDAAGDAPGGLEKLARPRLSSFEARVRKITSARVAADARDDQILASQQERMLVVDYLARRYRIAREPLNKLVKAAFTTGREFGLDPLLLLSVIAIESRFNPYAESGVGAQGLMQVMSRLHADKFDHFGGLAAAFDPLANLKVGALILKDCIVRGGSLAQGLRLYVGAISKYDGIYGAKVQAERGRLREVAQGRDVSIHLPQKPSRAVIQAYNKTPRGTTVLSRPKKPLVATAYAVPKNSKKKVVAMAASQAPKIVIIPAARTVPLELGENTQKIDGRQEPSELGV
ncbi:lytic transglycosylase domain-containing protein [Mycoavidus sp. SF9855]|uniref:lytic transglycosylase domain-containing protein n=1 Tax=Mycoavidus sp. SF9855 TaxID=2968475 RepID=UPI00211BAEFD|nr:lytic transglycosylase domain-containing protein [Mycoavidus sp. SF9855]UUM21672.1 lytic transglycosylase domain-containing protein [Mycoavidus sp. SF9855]